MLHEIILALYGCRSSVLNTEGHAVELAKVLHPSEMALLKNILLIGDMFGRMERFIKRHAFPRILAYPHLADLGGGGGAADEKDEGGGGLYLQAFCNGLEEVLSPYKKSVIALEAMALQDPYISLTSVHSHVGSYSELLCKVDAMIKEITENKIHGCKLLNYVCRHLCTGVGSMSRSLTQVAVCLHSVLVNQLINWLLYGQVVDPYEEFFVRARPLLLQPATTTGLDGNLTASSERSTETEAEKTSTSIPVIPPKIPMEYSMDEDFLPPFISFSTAYKIFYIGKTVMLFKSNPRNTSSESKRSCVFEKEEVKALQQCSFQDTLLLDSTISTLESSVKQRLWSLAMEDGDLVGQLNSMKDFYLLGRGEMFVDFLNTAGHALNGPLSSNIIRELNASLMNSARNVQLNDETVLEKFTFKMPPKDSVPSEARIKHVLRLDYSPSWPLHLFFSPVVIQNYNILFRYFLRVKQVQLNLHTMWITDAKDKAKCLSDRSWQLRNDLMFLVENLQCYLQWDVVESEYSALLAELRKSQDFEIIRQAHHRFLYNVLSQSFLIPIEANCDQSTGLLLPSSTNQRKHSVNFCLGQILDLCESFCQLVSRPNYNAEELEGMSDKLNYSVGLLMKLISNLRNQVSGVHLSKLLLRLDYNLYFSRNVAAAAAY